jgi:YD repeat-containing protein
MKDLTAHIVRLPQFFQHFVVSNSTRPYIAAILVSAMMFASVLPPAANGVSAHMASGHNRPSPFSTASPTAESFILGAEVSSPSFLTPYLVSIGDFFSWPKLPEGFEIAKGPSVSEKISFYFGSFLGMFTPAVGSSSSEAPPPPPTPSAPVDFDFDGDGKTDVGRWHGSTTEMKIKNSGGDTYSTFTVGSAGAKPAPGDFDGDGKTDAAVFLNGVWKYKTSTGGSEQTVTWGMPNDIPVAGDYDGDGKTDFAVFRPSTGYWWVLKSSNSSYTGTSFGTSTDTMVQGDYDGDGETDMAFFRPSTGDWHIFGSNSGYYSAHWGIAIDVAVPADYDGDGKTDMAVFRPTTGDWYAYKSSTNDGSYISASWGNYGDQPVPGYYDGDSKADFAVWRPTTGVWYVKNSGYPSITRTPEFSYQAIGVAGDTAVPSAYLKQVGTPVSGDTLNEARLSPKNATGSTDLYSRNFSWSRDLLSLRGRSGLDADFGMSYNSLVWIPMAGSMVFDPDTSNITPGFRFGFPVIEPVYYAKGEKDNWAYLMVLPSGKRVEFRQTSVGNTYEAVDSSYTQLVTTGAAGPNDPVDNITIQVTGTDGKQMSYEWKAGAFRCKEIKDANGNYVTIAHNTQGGLATVTDTLGRVVTVNHDSQGYPTSITQNWKNSNGQGSTVTHTWASFTYTTQEINTDFEGISAIFGPQNGTTIKVLQKVTYADTSHTDFAYNSYGQVWKIRNYADDDHELNNVSINIETPAADQTDCPRFTETKSYVENFNGGAEVTFNNSIPADESYSLPDDISGTATMIQTWMTGHPDNLRSNIFVGSSGWNEGLPIATEDCLTTSSTCSDRKRWTWAEWTQDDTGLNYPLNPRVVQSRVGDPSNVKKTTIDYRTDSGAVTYGLPETVKVYDTDLTTVLKQSYTQYILDSEGNLDPAYTSRRIIGLPSKTEVSGRDSNGLHLVSKMTYKYDEGNFSDSGLSQNISPVQHDNTNYSSSFVTGRGNLTSTTRWDVTTPDNSSSAVTSSAKYNTAGSAVSSTDPRGRVSNILYTDTWNDSVTRTTYAFPTTFTDAGGFSSTVKYRFDTGANVWARSPVPYSATSGNTYGKTTSRTYDDTTGNPTKEKIENTGLGAYTRYVYGSDGVTLDIYKTIVDANGDNTIDTSDEVRTTTLLDGAGRVRKSRTENPNSTGGYAGVLKEYDILGRVSRSTVPTEINSSWNPAGDDYRGMTGSDYNWLWNSREYDWKDRVTREINTDGTDRLYTYDGCGCAGGQITTIKGEITEALDAGGTLQITKRRTQKIYEDILGRTYKAEIWDLDGGGSAPYSTTKTTFNGRDQATLIRQYAGAETASTYQDTTINYDGHGRQSAKHLPEYDSGAVMSWTHNPDNSVAAITDPRGVVTTYKYGHADDSGSGEYRAMPTKIQYTVPGGSGIHDPTDVSYAYDAAGNRTSMSDETGSMAYSYDEISRLVSETKDFADTLTSEPSGGVYVLAYTYHLTGGIKSIVDPFTNEVKYSVDKTGRATAIGDALNSSAYASSVTFRAFGGLKSMALSATAPIDVTMTYDNRLRPATYQAHSDANTGDIHNADYSYHNDGTLKTLDNNADSLFSQFNKFDFAGRLKLNDVGPLGTGQYFKQEMSYDQFSNLTSRSNLTWDFETYDFSATYSNNRKASGGSTDLYDAAGNVTSSSQSGNATGWKFDAAGRQQRWEDFGPYGLNIKKGGEARFDGDGRPVKGADLTSLRVGGIFSSWTSENSYVIYSSVTGQKISELNQAGALLHTLVYIGNKAIARRNGIETRFKLTDPVTGSERNTDHDGVILTDESERTELAGLGTSVPFETGFSLTLSIGAPNYKKGGFVGKAEDGCVVSAMEGPGKCSEMRREKSDDKDEDPPPTCPGEGEVPVKYQGVWHCVVPPDETVEITAPPIDMTEIPGGINPDLSIFLQANPNCLEFMKNRLGANSSAWIAFLASLFDMQVVSGAGNSELMNKTLKELQIDDIKSDGTLAEESGTLGSLLGPRILAVASVATNTAYTGESYANQTSIVKGRTLFHEQLHIFFSENHFNILRALGLPTAPVTILLPAIGQPGVEFEIDGTGRRIPSRYQPPVDSAELNSTEALTNWLANNCK